ncbi:MAG: hypothetical protein ACJAQT_004734 [Akkermansiaceae bacterium]
MWEVFFFTNGDSEVLMPGDGPIFIGGFVEEDTADGMVAGWEDMGEG